MEVILRDIIVCSFYTDDDYYSNHANELKSNLDSIGVAHRIELINKEIDEDWVDTCRKKVSFLNNMCLSNPNKKIFWIDVDCRLLEIPDFVTNSSADIIGFQRGFSPPIAIGYRNHARFWEPCFWGIGTSKTARKMMADAAASERTSTIKATDDFFFEEGWRANAEGLTFQIIPSACVVGKQALPSVHPAFFVFGSSGNVEEYRSKTAQHLSEQRPKWTKKLMLKYGKRIISVFPKRVSRRFISISDNIGLTNYLLGFNRSGLSDGRSQMQRRDITNRILRAGINGETNLLEELANDLCSNSIANQNELATIEVARSFAHYASIESGKSLHLSWWVRPFPGNFGDWLSPFLLAYYGDCRILFQTPTAPSRRTPQHIIAVGSIARFIKANSVVTGTGISSYDHGIETQAKFLSVRGPITAKFLKDCGGPKVTSFGDPAILISRVIPLMRDKTNGRIALVRHINHRGVPLVLPENFDELSLLISHPERIHIFLLELSKYDEVVTSAMHVYIVCQSYGIPCSLITFEGVESSVSGSGLKYSDYSLGVGFGELHPAVIQRDLNSLELERTRQTERISEAKKDEIENRLLESIDTILKQGLR